MNHHYLKKSKFIDKLEIEGYEMYELGNYPAIVPGKGKIIGEVYEIDQNTLINLDTLEDEGNLYSRKSILTKFGEVYIYVYNYEVNNMPIIPYEMQPYNELVYYASYGSNLLEERFLTYIKGGICRFNGREYTGCSNQNSPIKSKPILIPYKMFYSKNSSSWNNKAVSFLDIDRNGKSYGKAYLITKQQFDEIKKQEGSWYSKVVNLSDIGGHKCYTFTSETQLEHKKISEVDVSYIKVLTEGIKESFPKISDKEIETYLESCSK